MNWSIRMLNRQIPQPVCPRIKLQFTKHQENVTLHVCKHVNMTDPEHRSEWRAGPHLSTICHAVWVMLLVLVIFTLPRVLYFTNEKS